MTTPTPVCYAEGMDTRNGDIYDSKSAALAAGVPEEAISELGEIAGGKWAATTGPFKGRIYRKNALGQMQRDKKAEKVLKVQSAVEDVAL